jgi:hypothetical protein
MAVSNWVYSGSDVVVAEGTTYGEHRDGPWRAGMPDWAAGRWCDVFEIRDFKSWRAPDAAGAAARPIATRRDRD